MIPETARSTVLRFGAFELDLNEAQVRKSGVVLKLRPQAFRVLTLLACRTGHLVTREDIQKEIWSEDTVVDFEQGLNVCIRQVRAVLGDEADSPRFIETIPRHGYRFLVPVTGNGAPTPARRVWPWMTLTAAALAAFGVAAWSLWPPSAPPAWRAVPLTSYTGLERDPALSPDGNQVAFTWNSEKQDNFDIYIKLIGGGAPLRLTTHPAQDASPAWSPDGRTIAFLRWLGSDRAELLLIPALGGPEHKLTETRSGFQLASLAWTPDGRWLAVSHREGEDLAEGLFLVSAQTGEKRRLTGPPRGIRGDCTPSFSPDGRKLAFSRYRGITASEVYLLPLSAGLEPAGSARRLTSDDRLARNPVWTREGRHILYVTGGDSARRELRMIAVSGSQTAERVASVEDDIFHFSLGRHLVYSRSTGDSNIWRAEIPPPGGPPSVPRMFSSSTRPDLQPRYSPDGKKIAFGSFRSGTREIWIAEADGSGPVQLTSFGGPLVGFMNWSPDGRRLVFHARPEGQADLFEIPASGGAPKRLTAHPSDDVLPSYSRDGRWIYFASLRSGREEIWKMPAGPGGRPGDALQMTRAGGWMPLESPDGKTLYYSSVTGEMGIWKVPVQGGEEERVTGPTSWQIGFFGFAVTAEGIYYTAAPDARNRNFVRFHSFATGQSQPVVAAEGRFGLGLSVSPDGRFVLFTQVDPPGSDLMLIENFAAR
ncbi:MAG: PD40 domain-containing protein [Acidobacteriia bacterium]|nr:PD40 domain-containing protein [Terriglobia bacterium]